MYSLSVTCTSIHPFSCTYPIQACWGCWSLSQLSLGEKAGCTLDRLPICPWYNTFSGYLVSFPFLLQDKTVGAVFNDYNGVVFFCFKKMFLQFLLSIKYI